MYFIVIKPLAIRYNTESNKSSASHWGSASLAEWWSGVIFLLYFFLLLLSASSHPSPTAPHRPSVCPRGTRHGWEIVEWRTGPCAPCLVRLRLLAASRSHPKTPTLGAPPPNHMGSCVQQALPRLFLRPSLPLPLFYRSSQHLFLCPDGAFRRRACTFSCRKHWQA